MAVNRKNQVTWTDPPPTRKRGRGQGGNADKAAQLRANPGSWAIVGTYSTSSTATSVTWQINTARLVAYAPAGAYEAVSRSEESGYRVYARYVGDDKPTGE